MRIDDLKLRPWDIERAVEVMPSGKKRDVLFCRYVMRMKWTRIGELLHMHTDLAKGYNVRALHEAARLLEAMEGPDAA
jgi:hypothetical protein